MIGRVVLAALLAGIAAGLFMGVIQHVRLTPLILEAETYENAAAGHQHGAAAVADSAADLWRTAKTFAMTCVVGAGYAAILAGFCVLTGVPLNRRNGAVAGLCGFLAFSLAPAAGLPPELPGMPAADLAARQVWWAFAAISTAGALWLLLTRKESWSAVAALVLVLVPHVVGAPKLAEAHSEIPAELIAHFVANSLAANGLFWLVIGTVLGFAMPAVQKDLDS